MPLSGKVAIVTGGAGGLGTAVVEGLLGAGAMVAVPYHFTGELSRLREEEKIHQAISAMGATLFGEMIDLTDEPAVADFYQRVVNMMGGIDMLINLAGGFEGGQPVHETPWSVWQKLLDVNLKTAVISSRCALPHVLARGGGSIVNVSTRTALQAGAKMSAYAASKRAVLQLTEALAAELRDQQITVNTIVPSLIDTPANREALPKADFSRWVKPAEIARVILFLVGPDGRVISGAHIPVYGRA